MKILFLAALMLTTAVGHDRMVINIKTEHIDAWSDPPSIGLHHAIRDTE